MEEKNISSQIELEKQEDTLEPSAYANNIRDDLDEVLKLKDTTILIGEFVPFGSNNVYEFCNKLDASKDVKSALLTEYIDDDPKSTLFETDPILTKVEIVDFIEHKFIEFNSELFYPEANSIKQEEKFGVRIDSWGQVLYGLRLKQVQGNSEVSVDRLSRVNADLIQDTSKLLNSLLTNHQRELMNLVFYDNAFNRDKYVGIMASSITPEFKTPGQYFDSGKYENEMKQVVEYITGSRLLPDGSKVFIGSHGLLLISPKFEKYEMMISQYVWLKSIQIFLSNFFSRIWILEDRLKKVRNIFRNEMYKDPNSSAKVQAEITDASYNCILLKETLGFLKEAIHEFIDHWNQIEGALDEQNTLLADILGIKQFSEGVHTRIDDAGKIIEGVSHEIDGLRDQINVFNERKLHSIFQQIKTGNQVQLKTQRAAEHQEGKLRVIEIIMSGSLALSIVELLVGEYSFVDSKIPWVGIFGDGNLSLAIWLGANFGIWLLLSLGIYYIMKVLQSRAEKMMMVKIAFNKPINLEAMEAFLSNYDVDVSDVEDLEGRVLKTVNWDISGSKNNPFGKHEVIVELLYDAKNGFLYNIDLEVMMPKHKEKFFKNALMNALKEFGVLTN